jgi:hypothetical protein
MQPSRDRDPLEPLFEQWHADTPNLPHSLTGEVWNRIETAEAQPAGVLARIELAFSRPAFAAAFVAACVLLGLFLAETRLSSAHRERSAELESYLSLLDPGLNAAPAATNASLRPTP